MLLIDGLDEYDRRDGPLRDWLVGEGDLPADAALLVASRSGIDLDLPAGHPLRADVLPLAATHAAVKLRALAMDELKRALADQSRLEYAVVGLVAAADGGLTPADLRALLRRMGISAFVAEITNTLGGSLHRTVTPSPTRWAGRYTPSHTGRWRTPPAPCSPRIWRSSPRRCSAGAMAAGTPAGRRTRRPTYCPTTLGTCTPRVGRKTWSRSSRTARGTGGTRRSIRQV